MLNVQSIVKVAGYLLSTHCFITEEAYKKDKAHAKTLFSCRKNMYGALGELIVLRIF